jgi:hypothetical protein
MNAAILAQRKSATESAAYFWVNLTKGIQDSTKGAVTSGRRDVRSLEIFVREILLHRYANFN